MPNLAGLCHICQSKTTRTCKLCGKPTCENHLEGEVCVVCKKGKI